MPSVYTQNLGLEKPATGEQAGTWGYTANNSYDYIDTATDGNTTINLGTPNYSLDTGGAGSQTQGQATNGRNKLIIWTGSLSQVTTVDIAPASAQKLYAMRNETSGNFPLQFKQGTGGSIFTLQPGHDAWIYADGASTVGAAFEDPQFKNVLVTGSFAVGTDLHNAVLSLVDPAPTQPSLIYQSQASIVVDMGSVELAISAFNGAWLQSRWNNSVAAPLALNPAGGSVGIGIGNQTPLATLDVGGNIRMSGTRTTLFYRGDAPAQVGGLQICGNATGTDGIVAITPTDNAGNPWNTLIHLGGFGNWNNAIVGLAMQGNLGIGPVQNPAEPLVIYAAPGYAQLRIAYGQYGVIFRNDGSNFYLMTTAVNDPLGVWNQQVPWPLQIQFGTNEVGIRGGPASGYALNVNGDCSVTGRINMGGTVNCSGYLLYGAPLVTGVTAFGSGGRALGTNYPNNTGKPMWVMVSVYIWSVPDLVTAYCDSGSNPGTVVAQTGTNNLSVSAITLFINFIVLPGWWYRVSASAGATLVSWSEWY